MRHMATGPLCGGAMRKNRYDPQTMGLLLAIMVLLFAIITLLCWMVTLA